MSLFSLLSRFNKPAAHPIRLLLAVLLLAVVGAFTLSVSAAMAATDGHAGMGGPGMGMHGGPRQMEHMLDSVNASAEQRTQIKAIMQAAMADLKAQRSAGRALHEQMAQAFAQPTVDARIVESLRQQQQAQHDAASKRLLQAKLEISRVLTPEQRQQLAERLTKHQAMAERHHAERAKLAPGGPGPGGK